MKKDIKIQIDGEQMIKVKLEENKSGKIVFKLKISDIDKNNILFKRVIIESKIIKGSYNYEVPLRFFIPICNNFDNENVILDKKSILSYLEFSDCYDEIYYTNVDATAKYMKKWREEGCPDIYRITISKVDCSIKKELAFRKNNIKIRNLML
jgi:hypothetical protein